LPIAIRRGTMMDAFHYYWLALNAIEPGMGE
jgi:hypothetical protein